MKSLICLLFALSLSISVFAAENGNSSEKVQVQQAIRLLEEWADATLTLDRIPGASLGFVADQKLIWSKGFGYADLEKKTPAMPDTIYGICSISKLFTAIALMQQRDLGKIRLDDPVDQYLPYAKLERTDADSPPVTIESLLTHSSGLPRESAHPYWTDPEFVFPTKEEIISGLSSQKMLYPSDRFFQYSNLGLTFAGEIVEKVTSKTYEDYVQDEILKPLKLSHTTPFLPEKERGKMLAKGYGALKRDGARGIMPFYETRGIAPAAGFASNVKDLAAFASWQFRLLENSGGQAEVLKASTLREMQRVHWVDPNWETTWGLGFRVARKDDQTWVGHNGACPGYFTALLMNPQKKFASVVMINAMNVNPSKFAEQMMKILGPALGEEEEGENKEAAPELERFAGLYWSEWGETIIVPWKNGLAALDLPSSDPMEDLTELKHVKGEVFQRVRKDGKDMGEEVVFESGPEGKVIRLLWHQNYSRKVR
jgi:CubicO group peptidase (beta-lactamase class C family)